MIMESKEINFISSNNNKKEDFKVLISLFLFLMFIKIFFYLISKFFYNKNRSSLYDKNGNFISL